MSHSDLQLSSSSTPDAPNELRTSREDSLPRFETQVGGFVIETKKMFEHDSPFSVFPHHLFEYVFSENISTEFQLLYDASQNSELLQRPPEELRFEYEQLIRYRAALHSIFASGEDFIVSAPNFVMDAEDFDIYVNSYDEAVLELCEDVQGRAKIERSRALDFLLYRGCGIALPSIYSLDVFEFSTYMRPLVEVELTPLGIFRLSCNRPVLGAALTEFLQTLRDDYTIHIQGAMLDSGNERVVSLSKEENVFVVRFRD